MSKLDDFKEFAKKNPSLVKYVRNNEMTWQKFYEIYDLYGEENEIWDTYLKKENNTTSVTNITNFKDIMSWVKNIDLDNVKNSIDSIQRVLGVLQDFGSGSETKTEYKPRPIYKHFED